MMQHCRTASSWVPSVRAPRHALATWLIGLFLLFAQHGGYLHGLSHLAGESVQAAATAQDEATTGDHAGCLQCLAYAALGSGLTPAAPELATAEMAPSAPAFVARLVLPTPPARYRSRAPPTAT